MKNIWDLYLKDSTVQPTELSSKTYEDSTAEFATGQTAFYQNGVWSYTQIKDNDVADEDLGMLPLYIGAPGESAYGPASIYDASWGVNEDSSDKDKQATLDFLKWLVSSDEGRKALSQDMGFSAPYTTFGKDDQPNNPLITAALEYQEKNIPFIRSFALPSGHWGDRWPTRCSTTRRAPPTGRGQEGIRRQLVRNGRTRKRTDPCPNPSRSRDGRTLPFPESSHHVSIHHAFRNNRPRRRHGRPRLVAPGRRLPDLSPIIQGFDRQRHRRHSRYHRTHGSSVRIGRGRDMAQPVLPVAAGGRRVRRGRLP
ncbi:MAG: extracellular solute-binding protein [Bifidobacterium breve]